MQVSYLQLLISFSAAAIAFLGLLWAIVSWITTRFHTSIEKTVADMSQLILSKLETLEIKLINIKSNGTDYSHNLSDKVESLQKTLYTEYYRRDDAEKDFTEIKNKLDRVEQKLDSHRSKIEESLN